MRLLSIRRSPSMRILGVGWMLFLFVLLRLGELSYSTKCFTEILPNDLNTIAYLKLDKELHTIGRYQLNTSKAIHPIFFDITTESLGRFSLVSENMVIDMKLKKKPRSSNPEYDIVKSQSFTHFGQDVMIFSDLSVGSWVLELQLLRVESSAECPSIDFEIGITPRNVILERKNTVTCPRKGVDVVPPDDAFPTPHSKFPFRYNSEQENVNLFIVPTGSEGVRWVQGYNFILPHQLGSVGLWDFKVVLGYDFISSGSLGLLLEKDAVSDDIQRSNCGDQGKCIYGVRQELNQIILHSTLTAGNYTFWIFDSVEYRNTEISPCSPISFSVDVIQVREDESEFTCNVPSVPTSLNLPGFLDEEGFLDYYDSPLLNLTDEIRRVDFELTTFSIFRVLVPAHRVDIDLALFRKVNATSTEEITKSISYKTDEGIFLSLYKGTYYLEISYFGSYTQRFCETFDLHIAIVPSSRFHETFTCDTVRLPNLDPLRMAIKAPPFSWSFIPEGSPNFVYAYDEQYIQKPIFRFERFTTDEHLVLKVELGFNFLLSAVSASIDDEESGIKGLFSGKYSGNKVLLEADLLPGTYSLVIQTAAIQSQGMHSSIGLPKCGEYSLKLEIQPKEKEGDCHSWKIWSIPRSFNAPAYLHVLQRFHFTEQFLVPSPGEDSIFTSESVFFSIQQTSLFRLYLEPLSVDIDFTLLYPNGTTLIASPGGLDSEYIVAKLAPGNYQLRITYWFWTKPQDCVFWNLECAIIPFPAFQTVKGNCRNNQKLPRTDLISGNRGAFSFNDSFRFQQDSKPLNLTFKFQISHPVFFTSQITYNFYYGDLSLTLFKDEQEFVFAFGVSGHNSERIAVVRLPPGGYQLQVAEPAIVPSETRRCIDFAFKVAFKEVVPHNPNLYSSCDANSLGSSFNSIRYLSKLSGNKLHFKTNVLINIEKQEDETKFSLEETSAFRAYVPDYPLVDVDLFLYKLQNRETVSVASSIGFNEEYVSALLLPGEYSFKTRYYPSRRRGKFPLSADCAAFPLELAIIPEQILSQNSEINTPCINNHLPTTLQPQDGLPLLPTVYKHGVNKNMTVMEQKIRFEVPNSGFLILDVGYEFLSGAIAVVLNGSLEQVGSSEKLERYWIADVGINHAYLVKVLGKGSYQIQLKHLMNTADNGLDFVKCHFTSLRYHLTLSSEIANCAEVETLPTDLRASGDSSFYGGPQKSDGSVLIFGNNFLLERYKFYRITFDIKQPSYVRVFYRGEGIDFDLTLSNSDGVLEQSFSPGDSESVLWSAKKPGEYNLELRLDEKGSSTANCLHFAFQLGIETEGKIQDQLLCPAVLPNPQLPPKTLNITKSMTITSDQYIFTKGDVEANVRQSVFRYRISLNVRVNSTLSVSVGFNFIVNDYILQLYQGDRFIAFGQSRGVVNRNSYFNFENSLTRKIPPGTYYLDILEDRTPRNFGEEFCHRFSFFFAIDSEVTVPHVEYIIPSGYSDLDPLESLTLYIWFSEKITEPSNENLQETVKEQKLVYLEEVNSHQQIVPTVISFMSPEVGLIVTFNSSTFLWGKAYRLFLKPQGFQGKNGIAFTDPDEFSSSHVYSTMDCFCNGRGHCSIEARGCICTLEGYAGRHCESCKPGFHAIAGECAFNERCKSDSCNHHGTCDDSNGYITCECNEGYASTSENLCGICAVGFSGYPNCTRDEISRPTSCSAELLPNTLNTPSYLEHYGKVHLQGYYYIDMVHQRHEMQFTLHKPSVFRVYTEPHHIDIDISLMKADTGALVDFGFSFFLEETIFTTLDKGEYTLIFLYYGTFVPCATFNLELEIAPKDVVQNEINSKNYCSSKSYLPNIPNGRIIRPYEDYNISFDSFFTVNSDEDRHFYNFKFTIAELPPGTRASLFSTIQYRFLTGDLGLILEKGQNVTYCTYEKFPSRCVFGRNQKNSNILATQLAAGEYILAIYQPKIQDSSLTNCVPFTFNFHIEFVTAETNHFECSASRLPPSLNSPGFIQKGHVHFVDDFLISGLPSTLFSIEKQSVFRASVSSQDYSVALALSNDSFTLSDFGQEASINAVLSPGQYFLSLSWFSFEVSFCPTARLEFHVAPQSEFEPVCFSSIEKLPSIGSITSLPFSVGREHPDLKPTVYTAFTTKDISLFTHTFSLRELASFEVGVSSNFLSADLSIKLRSNTTTITSLNNYNHHFIKEILTPDVYTLTIEHRGLPEGSCVSFNFFMILNTTIDRCEGEHLPGNLDGIRFLGSGPSVNFQSSKFLVPQSFTANELSYFVNGDHQSVFRAYVNPNVVDIDLKLFFVNGTGEQGLVVLQSSAKFQGEEELIYILEPNTMYALGVFFYRWVEAPACTTYNLEFSIEKLSPLPKACPRSGADNIPSLRNMRVGYKFNSYTVFNYQQRNTENRKFSFPITIDVEASLFADVGYDFNTGNLNMKLAKIGADHFEIYAVKMRDHAQLTVVNLPVGNYSLEIFESIRNPLVIMGCSEFSFTIDIGKAHLGTLVPSGTQFPPLPYTLNSLDLLDYNGEVHLENDYILFPEFTEGTRNISFQLNKKSLFRCRVSPLKEFVNITITLIRKEKNGEHRVGSANHTLLHELEEGDYTLIFNSSWFIRFSDFFANVEIAILPVGTVKDNLLAVSKCQTRDKPAPPPRQLPLDKNQGFSFNNDHMHVIPKESSRELVQIYEFSISEQVKLYSLLGYEFIIDQLTLELIDHKRNQTIRARNNMNLQELFQTLSAGHYSLQIRQPAIFDIRELEHCITYSFSLQIGKTFSADCTYLDRIPWDLNAQQGGTEPFGGPINQQGILHIAGLSFNLPSFASESEHSISLSLNQPSMLSIFVSSPDWSSTTISTGVLTGTSQITPIANYKQANVGHSLYYLNNQSGKANYSISLYFSNVNTYLACQKFKLDIYLLPTSKLNQYLGCSDNTFVGPPPRDFEINNNALTSFLSANFPPALIDSGSPYWIDVPMPETSPESNNANEFIIDISLRFNSLTTFFVISLMDGESLLEKSRVKPVLNIAEDKNLVATLVALVKKQGIFRVGIQAYYPDGSFNTPACHPYDWSLKVLPKSGPPFLASVLPVRVNDIEPSKDFHVSVIFSVPPYSDNGLVTADQVDVIRSALVLLSSDRMIEASEVSSPDENGISWNLVFPHDQLKPGKSYSLSIRPDILKDQNGRNFINYFTTKYDVIACGAHAKVNSQGKCVCEEGYAEPDCTRCTTGYYLNGGVCVKRDETATCRPNSCGCYDKECTFRLGECIEPKEKGQFIICRCRPPYDGPYCERCAPGFTGVHPDCVERKCEIDCEARGGHCNPEGVCEFADRRGGGGWTESVDNLKVAGIVFSAIVVCSTLLWYFLWKLRQRTAKKPRTGFLGLDNAREMDTNIVGIYDDSTLFDDEPESNELVDVENKSPSSNPTPIAPKSPLVNVQIDDDDDDFNPRAATGGGDQFKL